GYDAVILGVRIFNTIEESPFLLQELLKYVENGGTLIVQYNTSMGLKVNNIGPYPMKLSRERVTEEDAPVTILNTEHPVFNIPNKISSSDFEGWVQERGLYFAGEWDERYEALISCHDAGEPARKGGLL